MEYGTLSLCVSQRHGLMISPKQKQYLRSLLTEELEQLVDIEFTGRASAHTVELDQARMGRLSRMDALQSQAMSIEANRRRDQLIIQIKAALQRIDSGDYGICLSCGDKIDLKRLTINPATTLCVACAEIRDARNGKGR